MKTVCCCVSCLFCRSGYEDTVGGVDCVSTVQHSRSRRPCLFLRHVTSKHRLQTGLSDLHCAEPPAVSVLRQLRRQLSAVQRVRTDVPPSDDELLPTQCSTPDDRRLSQQTQQSTSLVRWPACQPGRCCTVAGRGLWHRQKSWNFAYQSTDDKAPTRSMPERLSQSTSVFNTVWQTAVSFAVQVGLTAVETVDQSDQSVCLSVCFC